jgi:hypothetical protein
MNDFYFKVREFFGEYHCCLYGQEIIFTIREPFRNFGALSHSEFKFETFITKLDVFLKANACPYEHLKLKFTIVVTDQFQENNCYGFPIKRPNIEYVPTYDIITKEFNKNEIIDIIMCNVNIKCFIHVANINIQFW